MSYEVRFTAAARDDLTRLYDYLLDRSTTVEELDDAERARAAIDDGFRSLCRAPFIYRKAGSDPFLRELLIPFGRRGYVVLFEIEDAATVTVLAVRHQLEDDYH
ncbi:plasmid stabilization protein [Pelomonas sp. Root1217]|uniref:type II toxin-antitoxin system RelE/ParE family toxin n=1 Tax=Pelomonas sp. Root1217 TaxID=1736430 RepID=UPI00070CAD20|nr:type II toxin-antitoxin system RelE/ParE family toxin [Pelomonas sp. Root1217]KQV49522.1 plasmid stabilization protein [Pelomonas sp. Root1217]